MNGRRVAVVGVLALIAASCGEGATTSTTTPAPPATKSTDSTPRAAGLRAVPVAARTAPSADPIVAGQAISEFGIDLFNAVRKTSQPAGNVTVSPASVAYALAMLEPGTVGDAKTQLRTLLRTGDPATYHASMNALQQSLETRAPTTFSPDDDPGEVTMRIANAAYLQQGYPFLPAYLQAVGSNYGPVLNEVDFSADPDAVAHQINAYVAKATNDRIPKLIDDGAIDPRTVLALVNALYLKASWVTTFDETQTQEQRFTQLDGATQTVEMMHGNSDSSMRGEGWIGAAKNYTGGISAQFILPDHGRFDEIAANLYQVFSDYDSKASEGSSLQLPKFDLRFGAELTPALKSLGLTAPYVRSGLLGVANDDRLIVDQVIHQTDVAMDEKGTEAAAATVVLVYPTSAPATPPVPVVLDRPFIYRIVDDQSGATLFIGQVLNPAG